MQEVEGGQSWNKKRIFIVFFIIALLAGGAYFFKNFVLGKSKNLFSKPPSLINSTKDVKGTSAAEDLNTTPSSQPLAGVQRIIQEKLNTIKQEITTIDIKDVASSSSQFQKIINDLQSLQQYPRNELKDVCQRVCGGL